MERHVPARDQKSQASARVLAYLFAINGVLASFGSASGASISRDQGSSFANVICAAAAAASGIGGDLGAPGKAHTHQARHCVLCGVSTHGGAPDQSVLPAFTPLPERLPGAANPPPVRTWRRCSTPDL